MKTINQDEINNVAWRACDTFRGTIDPAQYKDYILVMLFLKYLSDVWKDKKEEHEKEYKGDAERVKRRLARERFMMPEGSNRNPQASGPPKTRAGSSYLQEREPLHCTVTVERVPASEQPRRGFIQSPIARVACVGS